MSTRYTDELLDGLRLVGDPEADQLVADIEKDNQTGAVNAVLEHLLNNRQPIPDQLPAEVAEWLARTHHVPSWVDPVRLARASKFFQRHGLLIALILSTDSLVECYAARKGVRVLATTYRLGQNAYHRVAETAQYVIAIMQPGGLGADGTGIPATQKVRLLHAAIRYLIGRTGRWPEKELGVPLCQEDMLGTMTAFSYLVIRDLRALGVQVSDEEAEDYVYFWRAIAEMLGVSAEALPRSVAEAGEMAEAVRRRQHGPSADGVRMTHALLEMHEKVIRGPFEGLAPALIRRLCGNEIADWLEVPASHWSVLVEHEQAIGPALELFRHWATSWLTEESFEMAGYRRAAFDIPTALREQWGLDQPRVPAAGPGHLGANVYRFRDEWMVEGSVDEVNRLLQQAAAYPRWWPAVYLEVAPRSKLDGGVTYDCRVKGWLPYVLHLRIRKIADRSPFGFTVSTEGDLQGRGMWSLRQENETVYATFDWLVRGRHPLLRYLSLEVKWLFASNHGWCMRKGEKSIQLELARRHAMTESDRTAIPPPPKPWWPVLRRNRQRKPVSGSDTGSSTGSRS